ncbi:MAG TPA: tetratricopeptide repeat protein, partial [Pyrinomonadaceae bacterium]|nr:tetratricopeptide repeat protein [Pyrinomonadaceae bacterium]
YQRAISLNPNYPTAHQWFALYLRSRSRFDDAMSEIQRARALDPFSPLLGANAAFAYLIKNDLNSAIEADKKVLELDPGFWIAHNDLGWAYLKQRRYEEANAEFQKAVDSSGRASVTLGNQGHCYGVTGKKSEALAVAKELEERYSKQEAIGFFVATVYAGLGDKDQAFAWLEKDFQHRSGQLPFIVWWPNFDSMRSDPRFDDLVHRMGLTP